MEKISKEILQGYQYVRVIDVFILAPAMIIASTNRSLPEYLRVILFIAGVSTAAFNGVNYIKIEKALKE